MVKRMVDLWEPPGAGANAGPATQPWAWTGKLQTRLQSAHCFFHLSLFRRGLLDGSLPLPVHILQDFVHCCLIIYSDIPSSTTGTKYQSLGSRGVTRCVVFCVGMAL